MERVGYPEAEPMEECAEASTSDEPRASLSFSAMSGARAGGSSEAYECMGIGNTGGAILLRRTTRAASGTIGSAVRFVMQE